MNPHSQYGARNVEDAAFNIDIQDREQAREQGDSSEESPIASPAKAPPSPQKNTYESPYKYQAPQSRDGSQNRVSKNFMRANIQRIK